MENLKFNALSVSRVEKETNKNLIDLISTYAIASVLSFVKHGLKLNSDEQASDAIDRYLNEDKEKNTMINLFLMIADKLKEEGFFTRGEENNNIQKDGK